MRGPSPELDEKSLNEFCQALANMDSAEEIRQFLGEICAPSECCNISLRWHLMKLLAEGMPQRAIAAQLGLSLCKITRGSKYMKDNDSIFRKNIMESIDSEQLTINN